MCYESNGNEDILASKKKKDLGPVSIPLDKL
jgi:hypothetical protein